MKNIRILYLKIFILVVRFLVCLNRHVFVMVILEYIFSGILWSLKFFRVFFFFFFCFDYLGNYVCIMSPMMRR